MGEGENDVAIGNGQDLLSAGGKPLIARPGVALWAMSVAAGSILDDLMRAVVARQAVRAERGGAARGDVTENPLLVGGAAHGPSGPGIPGAVCGSHRQLEVAARP